MIYHRPVLNGQCGGVLFCSLKTFDDKEACRKNILLGGKGGKYKTVSVDPHMD